MNHQVGALSFTVLVVGDIRLYCEGIAQLLSRDGKSRLVEVATDVEQAIGLLTRADGGADVLLVDMAMPGSLDLVRAARALDPTLPVIGLAVPESEPEIIACAEAGMSGYMARDGTLDDLMHAVESAIQGELRCSPRIAMALMRRVAALAPRPNERLTISLTRREVQVLELLESGLSNKEIALTLGIEPSTAKNHVHRVLEKLGVHRRTEAAARLRRAPPANQWSRTSRTAVSQS